MLAFLKQDPTKKLKKRHAELLEKALHAQRNGDIRTYSYLSKEADDISAEISALEGSDEN